MGAVAPDDHPFPLTDTDRWVLSQTDEQFVLHDWADLKAIVEANDLAALKRRPSDLRRYMQWTAETKDRYGSTTNYLVTHRLPWGQPPFVPVSPTPFADPSDFCVLINDWPYGLTPNVTHLVVWLRTAIPTNPATGDMTPESRARVAAFVQRFFVDRIDRDEAVDGASAAQGQGQQGAAGDRVLWFKNWGQLQSVRQLEHVHVLVRDARPEWLQAWTTVQQPCHREDEAV